MSPSLAAPASASSGEEQPPPVPSYYYTGNGINIPTGATVVLFTHPNLFLSPAARWVFHLTGPEPLQSKVQVACGGAGCVWNHLNWSVLAGQERGGCDLNQTVCDVEPAAGYFWSAVMVRQNNNPPLIYLLWDSGKPGGTISGYVRDLDGQGVPGVSVVAKGRSSGGVSQVQPGSGFYTMDVKAGDYVVAPSGAPSGAGDAKYKPASVQVSVPAGGSASADFTLDGGMELRINLERGSVPADGMQVVRGSITTTEYGKPLPYVSVLLEPQPASGYKAAVTTGARVAVCDSGGGRIWPTGTLLSLSGGPVNILTDQNGNYNFTLTVGTVPGPFVLEGWARSTWTGELITGHAAWDEKTLTVMAPGTVKADAFVSTLAAVRGSAEASHALGSMTDNYSSIALALEDLGRSPHLLGGLAFSIVDTAAGGPAIFVYDDTLPPTMEANGKVVGGDRTLALAPGEWSGTHLGIKIATLAEVIQTGKLQYVPTYPQWAQGTAVNGWSLAKNTATLYGSGLAYNGWAYPNNPEGGETPGACY
jgi:hypothetical protein